MASRRPYTLPWFTGLLSKRHATKRKHKDEVETETLSEAASASTELATDEHTPNFGPRPGLPVFDRLLEEHIRFLQEQQNKFATTIQKTQRGRMTRAEIKSTKAAITDAQSGRWMDVPQPPSGTSELIGRLSRVRSEGLKNVLIRSFLEMWSSPAHRLSIIEALIESEAITKSQGLRLIGDFVPPSFHKTQPSPASREGKRGRSRFAELSQQQKQSQSAAIARAERQEREDRLALEEQRRAKAATTLQRIARGRAARTARRALEEPKSRRSTSKLPPPIRSRFRALSEQTPGVRRLAAPAPAPAPAPASLPAPPPVISSLPVAAFNKYAMQSSSAELAALSTGSPLPSMLPATIEVSPEDEISSLRSIASIARSIAQSFGPRPSTADLISLRSVEMPASKEAQPRPPAFTPAELASFGSTSQAQLSDRSAPTRGHASYRPPSARPPSFRSKLRALSEQSPVTKETDKKTSSRSQTSSRSATSAKVPSTSQNYASRYQRAKARKDFPELGLSASPLTRPPGAVSYRAKPSLLPPAAVGSPPIRPGNFSRQRSTASSDLKFVESLSKKNVGGDDGSAASMPYRGGQTVGEQRVWEMPTEEEGPPNNVARAVGTWIDAPPPPSGTNELIGRLSRVRAEGLKNVLIKSFLEMWHSPAHRLSIIEALIESEAVTKPQGLRLIGDFVPPSFEKTIVAAAFSYSEPAKGGHGPRQASLELHSDGAARLMVSEADPTLGTPYTWVYSFPNAAEDSDETTLRLRGMCTSEVMADEVSFELRLMEGGGWRGKVGAPSVDSQQWEVVFWCFYG